MRFFRIGDAEDKKDAMQIYCGVEIRQLEKVLRIQRKVTFMLNSEER